MELDDIYRPPQVDMTARPAQAAAAPSGLAPFFETSVLKVVLLTIFSFGMYALVWLYRNWDRRRDHGEDVLPLARSWFFGIFFVYPLFQRVNDEIELEAELVKARRGPADPPAQAELSRLPVAVLALFFVAAALLALPRIPGLALLSSPLQAVPLALVQKKMNELHASLGYDPAEGSSFTGGAIAVLVIGGLFWLLNLLGLAAIAILATR
jgi:hypothetical protein